MIVSKSFFVLGLYFCIGSVSGVIQKVGSNVILNVTDYYTVVASNSSDALDLFSSIDLQRWSYQSAIFDSDSVPLWANPSSLQDPDINVIGTNGVRIYFAARDRETGRFAVSVAFSDTIETERFYSTINRPLVQDAKNDLISPSLLVISATRQYLVYSSPVENKVYSVLLSADGLAVEGPSDLLLEPSLEWENGVISRAWIVSEDDTFYIIYTASNDSVIGIARSDYPWGPFVKRDAPIAYVQSSDLLTMKPTPTVIDYEGWLVFDT